MPDVLCERVVLDKGTKDENFYLVQYEDTLNDLRDKEECLAYLLDGGYLVTTEPHAVVGIGDEPAISWADLEDLCPAK